jgi:hypothetical protein
MDRELNQVELISVADNGQPANDVSGSAYISADGRFIIFDSFATNLTEAPVCAEKFNRCPQVYLRDRQQGHTYLLSQPANDQPPDDGSFAGDISGNAAYTAIITGATNLMSTTLSEPFYNRKGFIVEIKQITLQFTL